MDFKHLQWFLALAETQHFGQASSLCHISASALSRAIQQTEEKLGVSLFSRDNRSVSLTPEGEKFRTYARETLEQWEQFHSSLISGSQVLTGEIKIFCSVTASHSFLYSILSDFRRLHPRIGIKLHTGDPAQGISRIREGHEDIAIVARPESSHPSLEFLTIDQSPLALIGHNEHQLPNTPTNKAWQKTPIILSEQGITRDRWIKWLRHHRIHAPIYAQVGGHEAIVTMVGLGFGLGLVPTIVLDNSPLKDQVSILQPSQHYDNQRNFGEIDVALCAQVKRLKNPIVAAFWQAQRSQFSAA